jgi:hypothetical protein
MLPAIAREAERADRRAIWRRGLLRSLAEYFDRWGLLTPWYAPPGTHGRLWHLLHRKH